MTRWTAKQPVKGKHRRVFGRLWCRYTCGTCGSRSFWVRPNGARNWITRHQKRSPYCYERETKP